MQVQKQIGKAIRVGELAKRTGKTVRALHLYEELGLLEPIHRSKGNFRLYAPTAVERVLWIASLQDAGLSLHQLQELRGLVSDTSTASSSMKRIRDAFVERLRETREQMGRLAALEKELEASIAYLDSCNSCSTPHAATAECTSCNHQEHRGVDQPLLVAGIHRG